MNTGETLDALLQHDVRSATTEAAGKSSAAISTTTEQVKEIQALLGADTSPEDIERKAVLVVAEGLAKNNQWEMLKELQPPVTTEEIQPLLTLVDDNSTDIGLHIQLLGLSRDDAGLAAWCDDCLQEVLDGNDTQKDNEICRALEAMTEEKRNNAASRYAQQMIDAMSAMDVVPANLAKLLAQMTRLSGDQDLCMKVGNMACISFPETLFALAGKQGLPELQRLFAEAKCANNKQAMQQIINAMQSHRDAYGEDDEEGKQTATAAVRESQKILAQWYQNYENLCKNPLLTPGGDVVVSVGAER
jgi:hypothetical protein